MKIVILTGKCGDLCNRLFRFARFYCAKPRGVILIDISLFQYVYLFSPKALTWRLYFLVLRSLNNYRFSFLVSLLNRLPCTEKIDPPKYNPSEERRSMESFYESLLHSGKRIILVKENTYFLASDHESEASLLKLRKIFNLKSRYKNEVRSLLEAHKAHNKVISVHLRRRDYKTFAGGIFHFTNEEYNEQIQHISKLSAHSKSPLFILICEEPLNLKDFQPSNVLCFGPSSIGIDQALLESSDLIIGPASTFNAWVSFLHGIPRVEISKLYDSNGLIDYQKTSCNYIPGMLGDRVPTTLG